MKISLASANLVSTETSAQWAVRFMYLFFYAGMGVFFSFINIYYLDIGLTGVQIGTLSMLGPLVGVFSSILWGMASDRFGKQRLLFTIVALGTLSAIFFMSQAKVFVWLIPAVVWLSLFSQPMPSMMDSATFRLLKDQPERYGRYRVFGTVGFTLTSAFIGFLIERLGLSVLFPAYGLMILFYLFASFGLSNARMRLNVSPFGSLGKLVRQPAWLMFAVSVLILWIASSGAVSFIGVAIKSLGGSDRLVGMNWSIAALIELPVIFSSAFLLSRFGASRLVRIAFIGYFLRILFYGLVPTAGWALAANAFHAISYVPLLIGAASYANQLAPPELKATSQGLLFAVMNIGSIFGALLSGWLYDVVGIMAMFRSLAFVALAGFVVFSLGQTFLKRRDLI